MPIAVLGIRTYDPAGTIIDDTLPREQAEIGNKIFSQHNLQHPKFFYSGQMSTKFTKTTRVILHVNFVFERTIHVVRTN